MNKEDRVRNMWTGAKFTLLFMISIILLPFIIPLVSVMGLIATKLFVLAFIIWLIIIGFIALGSFINNSGKNWTEARVTQGQGTVFSIRSWIANTAVKLANKVAPKGEERNTATMECPDCKDQEGAPSVPCPTCHGTQKVNL